MDCVKLTAPDMSCADLSFMINLFVDRGIYTHSFLQKYYSMYKHQWCPHCINAKMRTFYLVADDFSAFSCDDSNYVQLNIGTDADLVPRADTYTFPITSAQILQILKRKHNRGCINIIYLTKYVPMNHELALLLLQNTQYHSDMRTYIKFDDVVELIINSSDGECIRGNIIHIYSSVFRYTPIIISTIIAKWRTEMYTQDMIVQRYLFLHYCVRELPQNIIDLFSADFTELFPLLILSVRAHNYVVDVDGMYDLTPEICPLDLADKVMAYSTTATYIAAAYNKIYTFVCHSNPSAHLNDLARLIISKHPRYIRCLYAGEVAPSIFMQTISLPEYDPCQIILDNLSHTYHLLRLIPPDMRRLIPLESVNDYLHEQICISRLVGQTVDRFYTVHDIIQVNCGIKFADITAAHVDECINNILTGAGYNYMRLRPINEISYEHILTLLRRNINVIHLLTKDMLKIILPRLHAEFWNVIRDIDIIMRHYVIPRDISDLVKMYYIKPTASDGDIVRMTSATADLDAVNSTINIS
jgi:hypothetical protein